MTSVQPTYYAPVDYSRDDQAQNTSPLPYGYEAQAGPSNGRPFNYNHANASTPNLRGARQSFDDSHPLPDMQALRLSGDHEPLRAVPQRGPSLPPNPRLSSTDPRFQMTSSAQGMRGDHVNSVYSDSHVQMSVHERRASNNSLRSAVQGAPSDTDLYDGIAEGSVADDQTSSLGPQHSPSFQQLSFDNGHAAYQEGYFQHPDGQYQQPGMPPPQQQQAFYQQPQPYPPKQMPNNYYYEQSQMQGGDPYYYNQPQAGPSNYAQSMPYAYSTPGGNLTRASSSLSMGRPLSDSILSRNKTSVGSTSQPITKAAIDEYRNRIKADPDPETQFNFAKYLIEAARKLGQAAAAGGRSESEIKNYKRYRDSLLQESLKLIKKLATQSVGLGKPAYADAQFFFANLLSSGSLGLAVDHEKAYNLYVQASKQNHAAATYRTAVCNEIGAGTKRDYNRAVLFYRKSSALGDAAGMYKLGMILLTGSLLQPKNPREAIVWLKRAAQQADEDNPHALHELGLLFEKQPPPNSPLAPYIPRDGDIQAREMFIQAAKLNYPPSQHKLGMCYEFGHLGCPVDPRRSIAYYTRAAEKGHASSELALSGWYLTGSDMVLKQSDEEAFLWARRAANKGLAKAEYAVGYYCEVGIGVRQDIEEAKRWYMRASAQNHKRAMQRLTELKRSNAAKTGRKARPTRQDAEKECIIM